MAAPAADKPVAGPVCNRCAERQSASVDASRQPVEPRPAPVPTAEPGPDDSQGVVGRRRPQPPLERSEKDEGSEGSPSDPFVPV